MALESAAVHKAVAERLLEGGSEGSERQLGRSL